MSDVDVEGQENVVTRLRLDSIRRRLANTRLMAHSNYTRFVIIGRSRVGSNLLRGLLNAHPGIVAFGEIFRDTSVTDWDHTARFQSAAMRACLGSDPVKFIDRHVFGLYPRSVGAAGFKLFYYHARSGQEAAIWPYLRGRADVKIIHLKRQNLLHTHLSRKLAALTDRWVNTSGEPEIVPAVRLDYEECVEDFSQTRAWEEALDAEFGGPRTIQVTYEDLAKDHEAEARRLRTFLSVPWYPVVPATYRQARKPLSSAIVNYPELKARFSGTRWAGFFTD